jgi:hypothetical protein
MSLRLAYRPAVVVLLACSCSGVSNGDGGSESGSSSTGGGDDASSSPTSLDGSESSLGPGDASSSDGTGAPDACATVLGSDAEPIFTAPEGRFTLRVVPGYTNIRGTVGEAPPLELHHELEREGACRLLGFEASTCTPACTPPAMCIDSACVSAPPFVGVGDVTLEGVAAEPAMLGQTPYHEYFWESVAEPAFDMPRLVGEGDVVAAFDLSLCPVDAPTPVGDWSAQLEARADGEDVVLQWSDPVDTARIYLRMTTGIATHGGISPIEVECEGPDVGELVLPGAYLDALYSDGWACGECGGNDLIRYHADQTETGAPTVQFRFYAITSFWHIP